MTADPLDTLAVRSAVLAAWAASPSRFREDANAEERLALRYGDRVLFELAANAVDAAREARVPARLRIERVGSELRVANTGAPLTASGVAGLASLRASTKRDVAGTVGHFGVGFTSVRALSDAPSVVSTSGAVRFDVVDTAEAVAAQGNPQLDAELRARQGVLPILRLPWAFQTRDLPEGYTTEVRLPLHPGLDPTAVLEQWRAVAEELLFWVLPELDEIDCGAMMIRRERGSAGRFALVGAGGRRDYRTVRVTGDIPSALLAELPVEERARSTYWVSWLLPDSSSPGEQITDDVGWPAVSAPEVQPLCAPTPTDVLLGLPATLIGSFVVEEHRRQLADSAINDLLLERAADAYLDLVAAVPEVNRWQLVPPTGFRHSLPDAFLAEAIIDRWSRRPLLTSVAGDAVTPESACWIDELPQTAAALFASAIPELIVLDGGSRAAAASLGIRRLPLADAVDALASLHRPATFWREVYASLADQDSEQLAGIPVPLVSGRMVLGARGLLVPPADDEAGSDAVRAAAAAFGVPLVDPAADHPLLHRLGARYADPTTVLADPAVAAGLGAGLDDLEADRIDPVELGAGEFRDLEPGSLAAMTAAVLGLLQVGADPEALPSGLLLTADDGEPWPAAELVFADSPLRQWVDENDLPTLDPVWTSRFDRDVLAAAGVRSSLQVITPGDPDAAERLVDLEQWLQLPTSSALLESPCAIADLDLLTVDTHELLAGVVADPGARRALAVPHGYTAWLLGNELTGNGRRRYRTASAHALAPLYEQVPVDLPDDIARSLGVFAGWIDAASDPEYLLDRLGAETLVMSPADATRAVGVATQALADRSAGADHLVLPDRVRTLAGLAVHADGIVVPDGPWWGQVLAAQECLPPGAHPATTSRLWQVPLASSELEPVVTAGRAVDLASELSGGLIRVAERWAVPVAELTGELRCVDSVEIRCRGREPRHVQWWPTKRGVVCRSEPAAVASALSWLRDRWTERNWVAGQLGGTAADVIAGAFDSPH